jgi:LmbE family N-acetylglucosaminyl deacetylase
MNTTYSPSNAPEAVSDPYAFPYDPVRTRPEAEHLAAIEAHQARIDEARNRGLLLDPEERDAIRDNYLWRPGYENTPRGVQLGSPEGQGPTRHKIALPPPMYL